MKGTSIENENDTKVPKGQTHFCRGDDDDYDDDKKKRGNKSRVVSEDNSRGLEA